MDLNTLKEFETEIKKHIPDFSLHFKDESAYHMFLGFLTMPFNPKYMTTYTTTMYPRVYFPTRAHYEKNPSATFTTLAHEFVHLYDAQKAPLWWKMMYALPQGLGVLPLIAFGVLAGHHAWVLAVLFGAYLLGCVLTRVSKALFWVSTIIGLVSASVLAVWLTGWTSAAFFGGLALMAPWPSPWRSSAEMRGYTMNLALMQWMQGVVPEILKRSVLSKFTTSAYYFMSWSDRATYAKITAASVKASKGNLAMTQPYDIVFKFLSDRNLLK